MLTPSSSSPRSLSPRYPRRAEERSSNKIERERSAEGGPCSAAVPPPSRVLCCPSTITEVLHRRGLLFEAATSPLLEVFPNPVRRRERHWVGKTLLSRSSVTGGKAASPSPMGCCSYHRYKNHCQSFCPFLPPENLAAIAGKFYRSSLPLEVADRATAGLPPNRFGGRRCVGSAVPPSARIWAQKS
ncbi:uncharacterized protein LOC127746750 isoform X2 [Arachis duranensis]|uniref:Uncharacterized protein LOC127746750 isoform X2 n=1 Tax=Arachis duranensis TaxID=130453 RepID=A0A9C6TTZ7_ARADU|nr:uncharacterized protein LOC127746750 isoform X2 [Arachis duranensis]